MPPVAALSADEWTGYARERGASSSQRAASLSCHCALKAVDQQTIIKRLGQKTDRTLRERAGAVCLARIRGDEDNRNLVTLVAQAALQIEAAQAGHVHVRDHARRILQSVRF